VHQGVKRYREVRVLYGCIQHGEIIEQPFLMSHSGHSRAPTLFRTRPLLSLIAAASKSNGR